jgi:molecular chaperone GrpE
MPNSRASDAQQGPAEDEEETPEDGVAELTARNGVLEDRYKRALADLENDRKRSDREVRQRVTENRDRLLADWLEAVDSVERALRTEPADSPLAGGLRAVLGQMEAILARQGLQRIGTVGEGFDPERHEAISVRATEDGHDRTVAEVARSGYTLGDRVLRPAQVVVTRRAEPGS